MASRKYYEYKKLVNNRNTKNFKFVTVKNSRTCKYCSSSISKGSECLTINKKLNGRQWICEECVENYLSYQEALAHRNSVAFDDEGAAMAMEEWVAECEEILDECGFFDDDD